MQCEGCGIESKDVTGAGADLAEVRADTGEVFLLCAECRRRVCNLDLDARSDLKVVRGSFPETRMRFFPSGYSSDIKTLRIDHKTGRRGT